MITQKHCNQHRRAFAAIMAIVLIGLVAATLAGLGMMFAAQARRTRSESAEAQLRQLLTAGAATAAERLNAGQKDGEFTVPLPAGLSEDSASLVLATSQAGDEAKVIVLATFGARHTDQSLKFARTNGKWTPISATLSSDVQPPASTQPSDRSTAASQRS